MFSPLVGLGIKREFIEGELAVGLFVALLAFPDDPMLAGASKRGILAGSLVSAGVGAALSAGADRARAPVSRGLSAERR